MWSTHKQQLPGNQGLRIEIRKDGAPVSFAVVLNGWRESPAFRAFFGGLLAGAPFQSFRWEMPALTAATTDRPFECVILNSPGLGASPDQQAFGEHFVENRLAVAFANLGGDALLVVPCPAGPPEVYGHLAAFSRDAPTEQQHAFWKLTGERMESRLGAKPVWLSTAGAGVSWLHVRLDDRPKYYGHAPYRTPPN